MSAINKRNPFAAATSFMDGIKTSFEVSRDVDRPAEDRPVRISFSVGTGRGNSKPDMTDDEFSELVGFICDNEPVYLTLSSSINTDQSPAMVASRTISIEDENVEFKVSLASGSRTVKVPRGQWGSFVAFLQAANDAIPAEQDVIWPVEGAEDNPVANGPEVHVEDENS